MQYRELLQLVMHSLNKPSTDSKQQIGNISRKIAQCVTELASAAEQLKDDDWVNPEDPTFIAENELMAAARSIENAGKKLSQLKPRREIKGKVSTITNLTCARVVNFSKIIKSKWYQNSPCNFKRTLIFALVLIDLNFFEICTTLNCVNRSSTNQMTWIKGTPEDATV